MTDGFCNEEEERNLYAPRPTSANPVGPDDSPQRASYRHTNAGTCAYGDKNVVGEGIMEVSSFAQIEAEFMERVHRMVWCNVATIDTLDRPRSRILHPLWEGSTGWITTRRNLHKAKHLAHNPYVSLAYIADLAKPVYVDCKTEWTDDLDQKQRIWQLCKETAPPVGFDPTPIYESPDHPNFGLLKLIPWRIELYNPPPDKPLVWHATFP